MSTTEPGRVFGSVAEAYDRGRPGYPRDLAAWLAGAEPTTVLELGAGTGKLTEQLVALGHDVLATDPDEQMLAVLAQRLPGTRTRVAQAEAIPAPDRSFEVVVAAQCFHWFDAERALPEIARVLTPHGTLALTWNAHDVRIPWVRRLGELIGRQDLRDDLTDAVLDSALFGAAEETTAKHWQVVDRRSIRDLVLSRSQVAMLPEAERTRVVEAAVALYDEYGRGMDGMQVPWLARGFRAPVVAAPTGAGEVASLEEPPGLHDTRPRPAVADTPMVITTGSLPRIEVSPATAPHAVTDDDSGVLLIDFR